uniref:Uncharacterized protein n=1 Tax=Octopus bimaculoides TaxID=37653 RepID=A0A0L8IHZ6_OCTBM
MKRKKNYSHKRSKLETIQLTYQKLSKYKELEIEISKMWERKTKTIPVVIGAIGMITKGADCYLAQIQGNPKMAEIQKIVLMGIAHILLKILSM